MKILAIADTEERCLWECFRKERFEGVDLILSAGDLDPDYLEFLVTVINKPLIYVRGNHDDRYARHAPGGPPRGMTPRDSGNGSRART